MTNVAQRLSKIIYLLLFNRKFDFINISLNESNNVEVAYGNGLNSKHKGKSPLTRPFKVSFEGDHCDDVNSNKGD